MDSNKRSASNDDLEIDPRRLLGVRITLGKDAPPRQLQKLSGKVGGKVGDKIGTKPNAAGSAKIGAKPGQKPRITR